MAPGGNNYDPKGRGSMLRKGDKLSIIPVMFPFIDSEGNVLWSLGLSNKTQAELDAAAQAASNAIDIEAKRKCLNGIKTLAFSTLVTIGTIKDKDGQLVDYIPTGTAVTTVSAIPVTSITTEQSFAADWTARTAGKAGVECTADMIAISKSNKPYRRVNQFDLF